MALAATPQTTFAAWVMAGFGHICPLVFPSHLMRAFGHSKRPLAALRSGASVLRPDLSAAVAAPRCAPRVAALGFGQAGVRASVGRAGFAAPPLSRGFGCPQPAPVQCSRRRGAPLSRHRACLTIHSSRRRFAARLNSGVRGLCAYLASVRFSSSCRRTFWLLTRRPKGWPAKRCG